MAQAPGVSTVRGQSPAGTGSVRAHYESRAGVDRYAAETVSHQRARYAGPTHIKPEDCYLPVANTANARGERKPVSSWQTFWWEQDRLRATRYEISRRGWRGESFYPPGPPYYHPTWGYHPTCWRRFPPVCHECPPDPWAAETAVPMEQEGMTAPPPEPGGEAVPPAPPAGAESPMPGVEAPAIEQQGHRSSSWRSGARSAGWFGRR